MNIPERIAGLRQWINWRLTSEGRKLPIDARTGCAAKSNDPTTWTTLEAAQATGGSLGFVFAAGGGLVGIDLDGCIVGGEIMPWALEVLERIPSYAEYSPSGTGIKIWAGGELPKAFKKELLDAPRSEKQPAIEAYSQGRYFAFTGEHYPESPAEIVDCQEGIDWLFARMNPPKARAIAPAPMPEGDHSERIRAYMRSVPPAIENSGGDKATFAAACKLVLGWGLSPEKAAPYFSEWNSTCEPPWDDRRLFRKLTEADKQPGPRGWLVGDERTETPVDLRHLLEPKSEPAIPAEPSPEPSITIPHELLCVPGLIDEVVKHNLATARHPQPELAFCGALALLAVLTGRKIKDRQGTRTNLYIVCPAPSGSGKDHARKLNKQILASASAETEKMIGSEGIGSASGFVTAVAEQPAILFQLDEMSDLMEAAGNAKQSPHLAQWIAKMLQLYTTSDSIYVSDAVVNRKNVVRIWQPHAVVYGTCTPSGFWSSLSKKSLNGGFVGRLIALQAGYVPMRPDVTEQPVPRHILEWVRWWGDYVPGDHGNLAALSNPQPLAITTTDEAAARQQAQALEISRRAQGDEEIEQAIWTRSTERVSKLALLFAASRMGPGRPIPQIEIDDVERAIAFSNFCCRSMLRRAFEYVSETPWEATKLKVLRAIGNQITRNELTQKTRWLKHRERAEAITELIDTGLVEAEEIPTQTKPVTVYKRIVEKRRRRVE